MQDHAQVCSLSRGMMLQPLSTPLQGGIRFLRTPLPALPTNPLAIHLLAGFPLSGNTGLPRSLPVTRLG